MFTIWFQVNDITHHVTAYTLPVARTIWDALHTASFHMISARP